MNNLHEITLQLLIGTEIPLSEIARGSKVGYRWLCQLQAGKFKDPGVKKIQRIHDFLTNKKVSLLPPASDSHADDASDEKLMVQVA